MYTFLCNMLFASASFQKFTYKWNLLCVFSVMLSFTQYNVLRSSPAVAWDFILPSGPLSVFIFPVTPQANGSWALGLPERQTPFFSHYLPLVFSFASSFITPFKGKDHPPLHPPTHPCIGFLETNTWPLLSWEGGLMIVTLVLKYELWDRNEFSLPVLGKGSMLNLLLLDWAGNALPTLVSTRITCGAGWELVN